MNKWLLFIALGIGLFFLMKFLDEKEVKALGGAFYPGGGAGGGGGGSGAG